MNFRRIIRALHRDLGYFFVGLTIIYGISGIILNYKVEEKDPAYREVEIEEVFSQNLTPGEVTSAWNKKHISTAELKRVIPHNNVFRLYFNGGLGLYNPATGKTTATFYQEKKLVKFMNVIHYNTGKKFTWMANLFAISLIFFAISGVVMLKGKNGFLKRGWWMMLAGLAIPIIWYFIVK